MSCNQKKKQRCPFVLMLQDGGCLPVEDEHGDAKAHTDTLASTDDGRMSAPTNADIDTMPPTTSTVQKSVSFSTNSTHPVDRQHQEQLQLPEAGGDKVRKCLEKHADTIYSLSSRSSLESSAAGVEYELNDYQLLNSVQDLHSWRSSSLRDDNGDDGGSESFEEELISIASDLVDEQLSIATDIDGSRYSVYNNFDDLFATASLLASESYERIRDSWTEGNVNAGPSRGSAAVEALDDKDHLHVDVDDYSGAHQYQEDNSNEDLMNFPGDVSIKSRDKQQRGGDTSTIIKDENNQLLKNLVIKCLVRNIEKKDGTKGLMLARDPSSTNYDDLASWSHEELNKLRVLPRDPSTLSTSGSKSSYHSQRSKGGRSHQSQGRLLHRDPSMHHAESIDSRNDDNSAGVQQRSRKLMDPPEVGVTMMNVTPSSQWQPQLCEPSIVSSHQRKPASISHHHHQHVRDPSTVDSVYHQHQMVHQLWEGPSHPYQGHAAVAAQPSTSELSSRYNIMQHQPHAVNGPPRPDVPRYSSNGSISGATPGHYSVQSLSGQSILRRKRYKEMLMKQRAGLAGY